MKDFFYWNEPFKQVDRGLLDAYFFKNPYQISRKYLQKQGATDIHTYGETPLTTMRHIVQECGIDSHDFVLEMGAGRGRTSFFLNQYVGCKVHAIERIPKFVKMAQKVAQRWACKNIQFSCTDMGAADFKEATVIYLYGSALSDQEIQELIKKFDGISPKTKIITISYPLSDYSKKFVTVKQFAASFPWGEADVYLNLLS
ncbi:MAG TPA: class I SAM-dependent methyltransferase [Rhabdochlamydiaceae bacterium]|nr:class I SAM-dependent methyltransferase [Rhabdochlamydiaceae bacterium]